MTQIQWDQKGERKFQAGVDRGVLYPPDGPGVAWNGLTSVEESSDRETTAYYLDGAKFLERQTPGEFAGVLKAFTYPDELDLVTGVTTFAPGVDVHDQPPQSFGLSYRTRLGDDVEGVDAGYRLHIIYNVRAVPDSRVFSTLGENATPSDFSWTLTATPARLTGYRPTAHVSFDSTKLYPPALAALEAKLYGTDVADASLPIFADLIALFVSVGMIFITDNGDGTWTASAPDSVISMLDAETFQITHVDATFLDAATYEISTSELTKEA